MDFLRKIYERAAKERVKIVLPEGTEPRILKAVQEILSRRLCEVVLLGRPEEVREVAKEYLIDLKGIEIIDPLNSKLFAKYTELYYQIRRHKGIEIDTARRVLQENPVFFSALAVHSGDADGYVAGASHTTRDVARAAIHCIRTSEWIKTVSSSLIIILNDRRFGEEGLFIFADCGIVPQPTSEQLKDIALSSVQLFRVLLEREPKVAFLSYSTKGSGGVSESIEKVQSAVKILNETHPEIIVDGELQADAAILPDIAEIKASGSKVAGHANILIFPNLDAGNISYKLVQRLAHSRVIGPLLQGLAKPVSDLSRGCDWKDIVDAVAITAVRAQDKAKY